MGFEAKQDRLLSRPLFETMWRPRTHRVSRGVSQVMAGTMAYRSEQKPLPFDQLEEALLIAATGCTGFDNTRPTATGAEFGQIRHGEA